MTNPEERFSDVEDTDVGFEADLNSADSMDMDVDIDIDDDGLDVDEVDTPSELEATSRKHAQAAWQRLDERRDDAWLREQLEDWDDWDDGH